ncbi:MAG: type I methionyl aminopeptidase [Myxococcales bacterium]|nr:type I methionyl aminopeptidase [Myxococcales bacterium]
MGIELFGAKDRARLRAAGRAAALTLAEVGARLRPGVTGADIDRWVREDTARRGGRPSQLGFEGFPATVCVSPNHVVCHGIPTAQVVLRDGDIVNLDVTTELDGFHGDTSRTFIIGEVRPEVRRLVESTEAALHAAIWQVHPGARLGDVGAVLEAAAAAGGYGLVREYCGHGIGRRMHTEPQVPHHGTAGRGLRLRPGMAFTIEPMFNLGRPECRVAGDGWTVHTADGLPSAQFEHTLLVTEEGHEVLTSL